MYVMVLKLAMKFRLKLLWKLHIAWRNVTLIWKLDRVVLMRRFKLMFMCFVIVIVKPTWGFLYFERFNSLNLADVCQNTLQIRENAIDSYHTTWTVADIENRYSPSCIIIKFRIIQWFYRELYIIPLYVMEKVIWFVVSACVTEQMSEDIASVMHLAFQLLLWMQNVKGNKYCTS